MEAISVFDIFKIGIGPSSSHTMGPWRAAARALNAMQRSGYLEKITEVEIYLYGSLAKTGKGHGTDVAVVWGLCGEDPVTCDPAAIWDILDTIRDTGRIALLGQHSVPFDIDEDIHFRYNESLPFHPNGLTVKFWLDDGSEHLDTYYSIGGGFVVKESDDLATEAAVPPYISGEAREVKEYCKAHQLSIADLVWENEKTWRDADAIRAGVLHIWEMMRQGIYQGCHRDGELPGGLQVVRRASRMNKTLLPNQPQGMDAWIAAIKKDAPSFQKILKWISCFALAINEENAAFGRVVTAPTNGAAGVIPAVLMYYTCFTENVTDDDVVRFLMVAGEIGSLFKKGATISAALGGCQAEIGVSSAMAAAALTECLGGSVDQALMAAEIAMEHHLGLTCDPVGGLVQIPCIERNSMGAIKAITAANMALESDPQHAKVSLDAVIKTMWNTAQDMHTKYKETSEGGLAIHIPVNVTEC